MTNDEAIEKRAREILWKMNSLAEIATSQMTARILAHAERQTALLEKIADLLTPEIEKELARRAKELR